MTIREAIIETSPDDMGPVAGVPLVVRTVLVLQRAGIERCTVTGIGVPPSDPRIRCTVTTARVLSGAADPAPRLVVGPGAVIDVALVRDAASRARPGEVLTLEHDGAQVRVAPGPLVAAMGGPPEAPRAGTLESIDASRATVERALLQGLENPHDGYLDRVLQRRISRPLTRLLLRTSLSANAVTVLGIALGVAGGLLLGAPGTGAVLLGVSCLLASGVLDCSDGDLARLRFAESRLGHWLDMGGDTVVHVAVLGGIVTRLARTGAFPGWRVLGALVLGVAAAFAVITWSEQTEDRRQRAPGWENAVLDRVLSPLTTRDWHFFVVVFALASRLDLLVPAAAVGAQVFWLLTLALLVRVLGRTRQLQGSPPRVVQ